jgi:hypothetical protein
MVPGFSMMNDRARSVMPQPSDASVALAGPWDFDDGSGKRTKICGNAYAKTSCQGLVLFCRDCRQCRWSDSAGGYFEDCAFWYPCGVCVGADW